jgi:hypothetical protein
MKEPLKFSDLLYWCEAEIIDFIIDEGLGIKRLPVVNPNPLYPRASYVVTKELQVFKFSGLILYAWLTKELYEGRLDSVSYRPAMNKEVTEAIRLFINGQVAKSHALKAS